ncbi:MAG TPA: tetratricopeptide repeat protein [Candidatus Paceibacterota bacterium]|nr:tetratricopeptide repeat protein [Candidatus Paceibacterota bacterium]
MADRNRLAKILKWCIYALALMPLIIFSQYISPFHFGKVVIFRAAIELMAALWLILIWLDSRYRPRLDKMAWAVLALTAAFTITTFTSVQVYQSFWGSLERMGGLFSFWHFILFYFILVSVLRSKEDWRTFLKVTVVVGLLSALYGFGQRTDISFFVGSGGRERIFGTIGNAALFAGYQILDIFLALILAFTAQGRRERDFFITSAVLMSIAVFMTAVRGSMAGLGIGLLVFAFLYFSKTHAKRARQILLGLLVLAGLGVLGIVFRHASFIQNSPYLSRVTDISPSAYTIQTRVWAWTSGLEGWKESPKTVLLGWGPENFDVPFSKHFNPEFYNSPGAETFFDRAHDVFVNQLVTQGLVGLIAYIWLFVVIFQMLWREKNDPEKQIPAMALIAMMIAYIIHNSFIFDTSANYLVLFTSLGYISFLNAPPRGQEEPAPTWKAGALAWTIGTALVVVACILLYQTDVVPAKANYATTRGMIAGLENHFDAAVADFQRGINYQAPGVYEETNQYAQFLIAGSFDTTQPNVIAAFKDAIAKEEQNAKLLPAEYLPDLYLSRLNLILGKNDPASPYNDEALKWSNKALVIAPTFPRTYYEIGQAYLNQKNYAKAEESFQKAIDLNSDNATSWWYLGISQITAGQIQKGLETVRTAFQKGYQASENDYLGLVDIYVQRNDYQDLVMIYENLIKINPNNVQYHVSLALSYAKIGRIDDAVAQAHQAADLDPSYEQAARQFVQSLGRQW